MRHLISAMKVISDLISAMKVISDFMDTYFHVVIGSEFRL